MFAYSQSKSPCKPKKRISFFGMCLKNQKGSGKRKNMLMQQQVPVGALVRDVQEHAYMLLLCKTSE